MLLRPTKKYIFALLLKILSGMMVEYSLLYGNCQYIIRYLILT
jgi:hypothetical protein